MFYDDLHDVSFEKMHSATNWQAQYRLITQWGKLIATKPELHQPNYLLKGCETPAWLKHDVINDQHRFLFDSHSRVINGLVAMILAVADNKNSAQLLQLDIEKSFTAVGLHKHLTPSRNNGLQKIITRIYTLAQIDTNMHP